MAMFATNRTVSRFGFVVSKKVSNKTTVRNLVKRRLRYAIAKHLRAIKPGFDCVFLAKPKLAREDYAVLEREVLALLSRADLFKK